MSVGYGVVWRSLLLSSDRTLGQLSTSSRVIQGSDALPWPWAAAAWSWGIATNVLRLPVSWHVRGRGSCLLCHSISGWRKFPSEAKMDIYIYIYIYIYTYIYIYADNGECEENVNVENEEHVPF